MKSATGQGPGAPSPTNAVIDAVIDDYFTRLMNEQIRDEFGTEPIPTATPKAPESPSLGRRLMAAVAVSVAMAFSVLLVVVLTGCSGISAPGDLGVNQKTLATCPSNPLASRVAIDVSGSVRAQAIPELYAAAVQDLARRTAVCGGHLSGVAFSASSAATVSLFEGELQMPGSTENARLRRVPQAVEEVMKTVGDAYADKASSLTPGGTDIVAQYRLADEYVQQLGGNRQLDLRILTDGVQSVGTVIGNQPLSAAQASQLADQFNVTQLPGASITVDWQGQRSPAGPDRNRRWHEDLL